MSENTLQDNLSELMAKIHADKEKQLVRQEKANAQRMEIEVDVLEEAQRLNGQTQAINNLDTVVNIVQTLKDVDLLGDEYLSKHSTHLVKDALKRARASFRAQKKAEK